MAEAHRTQMSGLYASGELEYPAYDWGDSLYEGGGVVTYESVAASEERAPESLYSVVDRTRPHAAEDSEPRTPPGGPPPRTYSRCSTEPDASATDSRRSGDTAVHNVCSEGTAAVYSVGGGAHDATVYDNAGSDISTAGGGIYCFGTDQDDDTYDARTMEDHLPAPAVYEEPCSAPADPDGYLDI